MKLDKKQNRERRARRGRAKIRELEASPLGLRLMEDHRDLLALHDAEMKIYERFDRIEKISADDEDHDRERDRDNGKKRASRPPLDAPEDDAAGHRKKTLDPDTLP